MGLLPASVVQSLGLPAPIVAALGGTPFVLTGTPTSVETSEGVIINVITTGNSKRARASTGQESEAVPISPAPDQNIKLIEKLARDFRLGGITKVLSQETGGGGNSTAASSGPPPTSRIDDTVPFDQRFVYIVSDSGQVIMSLQTNVEKEMVDGFLVPKNGGADIKLGGSKDTPTEAFTDFYGVPSIMNENAYINLQAAGGKGNNKNLIDRENQPRFYDNANPKAGDDNLGVSKTPTTTSIINWSSLENNRYKFPYKYQDFVYCKWWQKIPNNYMLTLRRYPFPVLDVVTTPQEARNSLKLENTYPVSTMISYMGEDPGNKISEIVGSIETGLNWKEIEADVHTVTTTSEAATVNNPAPTIAKALGFIQKGAAGGKERATPETPIDPYNSGPYANKILGPVNVITKTQARDRGLMFKHEIKVVFEYSLRSIGGINTKAAALDILANALLMTSASAAFWGGMNRWAPHNSGGDLDPFLGGDAGRTAWINGDPLGFFNAVTDQFNSILSNVSDFFSKISADPIGGLKDLALKGAGELMKLNVTDARGQVSGLHSLLTGAPVGEWHLQVGNPLNPIMMIGNLICTGSTIEFSDELGPDDFPTELKVTITLEHGMPRDKDGIESMFNAGSGRIYSLPKGYADSLSSSRQSNVDASTAKFTPDPVGRTEGSGAAISAKEAGRGGQGSRRAIIHGAVVERTQRPSVVGGDVAYEQMYSAVKLASKPSVRSAHVSLYSMGAVVPGENVKKN